jgi:GNAT superfamily N-acetyltransferase
VRQGLKNAEGGVTVRRISVADARVLRDRVLLANMQEGQSVYPGDDAPDTLHAGAFVDGLIAGVATVCRDSMPGGSITGEWRLRGMATLEEHRGRGFGRCLAERCAAHATYHRGFLIWCSARMVAVPFYLSLGFKTHGEKFHLPEYSSEVYIRMLRPLLSPGRFRIDMFSAQRAETVDEGRLAKTARGALPAMPSHPILSG